MVRKSEGRELAKLLQGYNSLRAHAYLPTHATRPRYLTLPTKYFTLSTLIPLNSGISILTHKTLGFCIYSTCSTIISVPSPAAASPFLVSSIPSRNRIFLKPSFACLSFWRIMDPSCPTPFFCRKLPISKLTLCCHDSNACGWFRDCAYRVGMKHRKQNEQDLKETAWEVGFTCDLSMAEGATSCG